jgi:hypothetical protein
MPGVTLVKGKKKPVTLVRTVVARKVVFQEPKSLPLSRPEEDDEPSCDADQTDDDVHNRVGRQTHSENHGVFPLFL